MKKNLIILSTVLVALAACEPKAVEPEQMFKTEDEVTAMLNAEPAGFVLYDEASGGLNKFVEDYMTEKGNYELVRTRSKVNDNFYLFSIDTIPTAGKGIYIRGRVTTDDGGGNFYKAMVIQQIVGGEQQALRLSVDMGNASGLYPLGQEILIRVNGLAIGRYANQPQLCVPSFNNNVNANKWQEKVGWAPGRIPAGKVLAAITRIGLPDKSKLVYDELTLDKLVTYTTIEYKEKELRETGKTLIDAKEARKWDGRLVRVRDIFFTGEYATTQGNRKPCSTGNPETDGNANVFGPTTDNMGYPQSRVIAHSTSATDSLFFMVSTSEYAKYAHMYLPASEFKGDVVGILGFYMDNSAYEATWKTWSVSLRDLSDLELKNGSESWKPVEWENIKE